MKNQTNLPNASSAVINDSIDCKIVIHNETIMILWTLEDEPRMVIIPFLQGAEKNYLMPGQSPAEHEITIHVNAIERNVSAFIVPYLTDHDRFFVDLLDDLVKLRMTIPRREQAELL